MASGVSVKSYFKHSCSFRMLHMQRRLFCLYVCLLGFYVPLQNFSLIFTCHHYRRATNFGFFNGPHLLWHGLLPYNGHLQRPVTLTPVDECLTVELSLPVIKTYVSPDRGSNTNLPHARRTFCQYATAVVILWEASWFYSITTLITSFESKFEKINEYLSTRYKNDCHFVNLPLLVV